METGSRCALTPLTKFWIEMTIDMSISLFISEERIHRRQTCMTIKILDFPLQQPVLKGYMYIYVCPVNLTFLNTHHHSFFNEIKTSVCH